MGERLGGRQKGTKNKATIERENLISRAIGELNRPLGKDVLAEVMMEFRRLAQELAAAASRDADSLRQDVYFLIQAGLVAHKLAPFESPRFAPIDYALRDADLSQFTTGAMLQISSSRPGPDLPDGFRRAPAPGQAFATDARAGGVLGGECRSRRERRSVSPLDSATWSPLRFSLDTAAS